MNTRPKPIKRHEALKQFSRDHHFGLLLCWKIREGFKRNISVERMKKYTDYFFEKQLKPHFELEEKYIFTLLSDDDKLKKRAISEHKKLAKLFNDNSDIVKSISLIEEKLDEHIRFEERILFNEIQQIATPEQLKKIEAIHEKITELDWDDNFWEIKR